MLKCEAMKIAIFSTTFFPQTGGAERFMHGLATRLVKQGHQVVVIAPIAKELNTHSFSYKVFRLRLLALFIPSSVFYNLTLLLNLFVCYWRHRFEVLQVVGLYPAGEAARWLVRFLPKVTLVARATGSDILIFPTINYGLRLDPKMDARIKNIIHAADALVANSNSVKEEYLKVTPESDKIVVIPNALDLDKFVTTQESNRVVRRKWCDNDNARIVLSVGRNEERKNFALLIQSMEEIMVKEEYEDVYCVIVGAETKKLKSLVEASVIENRFIFAGPLPVEGTMEYENYPPPELIELYLASSLFALPSTIEGQPNVLLEAMAAGLPMVAGNVPGSKDVIEHGKTGFLVDLEHPAEFTAALERLLLQPELHQRMSLEAKKKAQDYNWDIVVDQYLRLYLSCNEHK